MTINIKNDHKIKNEFIKCKYVTCCVNVESSCAIENSALKRLAPFSAFLGPDGKTLIVVEETHETGGCPGLLKNLSKSIIYCIRKR